MMQARAAYDYSPTVDPKRKPDIRRLPKHEAGQRTRKGPAYLKIGCYLLLYSLALVYLCIHGAALGYQIIQMEAEIHQIETANQRMVYAIAEKSSLQRIETLAVKDLNMYKPQLGEGISIAALAPSPTIMDREEGQPVLSAGNDERLMQRIYNSIIQTAQNNQ